VETESIPQQAQPEEAKQIETADLVIGVLSELDPETLSAMCGALAALQGPAQIAILQEDNRKLAPPIEPPSAPDGVSLHFVPSLLASPTGPGTGPLSMAATYQSVFAASEKLQSRGCCIIASRLESPGKQWAQQLARPLLESEVDLVVPCYAHGKFEGLLNNAVIAPLTRALYGRRVHNPMGPDFAISKRLYQKLLNTERAAKPGGNGVHPLASIAPAALCDNLTIVEAYFGARKYPPPDWTNTSSILAEALGPIFLDMERRASCWQRSRAATALPVLGTPYSSNHDGGTIDTSRLLESFQLGNRELLEIWGLVLPPYTLLELKKLARVTSEQFRMPDRLWARIVYDFSLAHRLRTINRDHLLKSMTPLYLGWVASYVHELQADDGALSEQLIERLAAAFEAEKPYLVSRWRWPDRFNP
jgi:glucosylglycerate synthase